MLTIFAIPKPFRGDINVIQRNAIQSWLCLSPKPEIILFGSDEGIAEAAKEFGILHVPEVESEFGIPILGSVFLLAQKKAQNPLVAYVNADIILTSDFTKALTMFDAPQFLMTGQRWDIGIKEPIRFDSADWERKLRDRVKEEGKLHGPAGMDYFIFPRTLRLDMPHFVAGRPGYDNWLVYKARSLGIPMIDATELVMILHQNHDYRHRLGGEKHVLKKAEGKRNIQLAGGFSRMLTLRDADWILTREGLKRPGFPKRIFSILSLFYPWRRLLSIKRQMQQFLQ